MRASDRWSLRLVAAALFALTLVAATPSGEPPTLELVQTIPLQGAPGRMDHLALDAKNGRLFIANLSNDSLDIVDLKAARMVKQITGQKKSQGVAYVPDLDRIYQGNGTDWVCNVFDGTSFQILHTLPFPDADNVRYNPATGLVYIGHAEKSLSAFDAKTYSMKATIKLPGPPEAFQLDPERKRMYVNCLKPATVAVVDLDRHEVMANYKLALADACYPMAYDPATQRVFVGCRKKPMLVVLDGPTGKELAGVPIPGDIDDLSFDAKRERLYAICGEGFVAVIGRKGAGEYEVIDKIATDKLARTGLFDAASGRLYVPVPRQGGRDAPELRVFQAKP